MKIAAVMAGAAIVGGGLAWASTGANTDEGKPRGFWQWITPHGSEVNLPQTVGDIANKANAIVLAQVTGIVEGREDRGCLEPGIVKPEGKCPINNTVFVQLTVNRVIHGSVSRGQVINLEMYRPPRPLTIESVQENMPPGQLLFFLRKAPEDALNNTWGPVSITRAVIAQGPTGLYTALEPTEPNTEFIQSFRASTVDEAADRAAAARSK